jgi:hypothetical protein
VWFCVCLCTAVYVVALSCKCGCNTAGLVMMLLQNQGQLKGGATLAEALQSGQAYVEHH